MFDDSKKIEAEQAMCQQVYDRLKAADVRPISVQTQEFAGDRVFLVTFYADNSFGSVNQETIGRIQRARFKIWMGAFDRPITWKEPEGRTRRWAIDHPTITIQ